MTRIEDRGRRPPYHVALSLPLSLPSANPPPSSERGSTFRGTRYSVSHREKSQKLGMKNFLKKFKKRLDFSVYTQYNLNVREERRTTKNRDFDEILTLFFVTCDKDLEN